MKWWKNFKCILLSERSQSEKFTYCIIPIMWHSGYGKITETIKGSNKCFPGAWSLGGREMNMQSTEDFKADKIFCM